eukprot:364221-Chlamydomonas_euryale.AAC.3
MAHSTYVTCPEAGLSLPADTAGLLCCAADVLGAAGTGHWARLPEPKRARKQYPGQKLYFLLEPPTAMARPPVMLPAGARSSLLGHVASCQKRTGLFGCPLRPRARAVRSAVSSAGGPLCLKCACTHPTKEARPLRLLVSWLASSLSLHDCKFLQLPSGLRHAARIIVLLGRAEYHFRGPSTL